MSKWWHWNSWRLKTKLLILSLTVSTLGMILICFSLIVVENRTYEKQLESELHVIANILAEQSAAALLFEDTQQLKIIISSLREIETIEQACVYGDDEQLMAQLNQNAALACPDLENQPKVGFLGDHYRLMKTVTLDGELVGHLYTASKLEVIREHIRTFILIAFSIGFTIQGALGILAFRLQRLISEPIAELSHAAEQIAVDQDYSIRAPVRGEDELGRLGNAFNEMLGTIEQQNLKILASRDDLERTVAERTSELSLANRELEAFSFSVSHDLRQPLRAIEGFGQALEEDCRDQLNDAGLDYLSRIRTATVRMGGLIDGLLVLSRVSRQPMEICEHDVSTMLKEIVEELQDTTDDLPTDIKIQSGISLVGDGRMLRIAFQNLLANAWKYSSKKHHRLIAVYARETKDHVTVTVEDNGVGFDMKYVNKLFVAFNRLHTPAEFSGTGLGLATVDRVVRRHFGEISAESSVDNGARFSVRFPLSGPT